MARPSVRKLRLNPRSVNSLTKPFAFEAGVSNGRLVVAFGVRLTAHKFDNDCGARYLLPGTMGLCRGGCVGGFAPDRRSDRPTGAVSGWLRWGLRP